jgi:transformer-2 protein
MPYLTYVRTPSPSPRPHYIPRAIGVVPRRPEAAPKAEPNNVLGVFGLSIRTRERDLEEEFARHGEVDKVVIVYDQRVSTFIGLAGSILMASLD